MNEVTIISFALAVAFGAGCLFLFGGGLYLEVLSLRDKWKNFVAQESGHEKGGNEMKRKGESGQSMAEYALILIIVAIVVYAIWTYAIASGGGLNGLGVFFNRSLKELTISDLVIVFFMFKWIVLSDITTAIKELKPPKPPVVK